ncbi:MAG: hypothetical protein FD135_4548 [Comamonadaceae bacterium]|nr:MAG: hypothetical protein FD135_4548 [Comamonadaceae bacterium]
MNNTLSTTPQLQKGASLVEVLVSILILSFGMLSLGAMLGFAVQAPKISAHRATATNLASAYIEMMRANKDEFAKASSTYLKDNTFDGTTTKITAKNKNSCTYPDCSSSDIAKADFDEFQVAIRDELPAGGFLVEQDSADINRTSGNLWIMWTEPQTFAALNTAKSDNCPTMSKSVKATPSCLYVRFKL